MPVIVYVTPNRTEHEIFGDTVIDLQKCELCGEPMPNGETMFKFHGYSGPCPKPPLPVVKAPRERLVANLRQIWLQLNPLIDDKIAVTKASALIAESAALIESDGAKLAAKDALIRELVEALDAQCVMMPAKKGKTGFCCLCEAEWPGNVAVHAPDCLIARAALGGV